MLKTDRYQRIPKLISTEFASFLKQYLEIKRQANIEMRKVNYISHFDERFGTWGDPQIPGKHTFILYGDPAFDVACDRIKNKIQPLVNRPLHMTYSYARIYMTGDELKRHTDRNACEISASINLGGDPWSLYVKGHHKDIKIDLKPGDGVVYYGLEIPHWRKIFEGKECYQFFLHYSFNKDLKWDRRVCLGIPANLRSLRNSTQGNL